MEAEGKGGKLELIALKHFPPWDDMYQIVDFLNKNLKGRNLMFGLRKEEGSERMTITIYEVE